MSFLLAQKDSLSKLSFTFTSVSPRIDHIPLLFPLSHLWLEIIPPLSIASLLPFEEVKKQIIASQYYHTHVQHSHSKCKHTNDNQHDSSFPNSNMGWSTQLLFSTKINVQNEDPTLCNFFTQIIHSSILTYWQRIECTKSHMSVAHPSKDSNPYGL